MKLTLLTYDSMVAHNAGYSHSCKALEFAKILTKLVDSFSKETGVGKNEIYWQEVTQSDWCKNMVIIYAQVDKEWKPTAQTSVLDESYDPKWYSQMCRSLSDWIYGNGRFTNIEKDPAQNPHSLFRTVKKS